MRSDPRATLVVGGCIVAMWAITIVAVSRAWGPSAPWLVPAAVATGLWALLEGTRPLRGVEPRARAIAVFLRYFVAWVAVAIASLVLVQEMATSAGPLSAWATGSRPVTGLIVASGLVLFGNAFPVLTPPASLDGDPAAWQRVHRFVGWTLVLTGLGIGAAWIALDPAQASQATNRLLALGFFLIGARKAASLWGSPPMSAPTIDSRP